MSTWRIFIGDWNDGTPEWEGSVVQAGLTWEQARDQLAERFNAFKDDHCPPCQTAGTAEAANLAAHQPDTPFFGYVDGDDYVIVPDRPAPEPAQP